MHVVCRRSDFGWCRLNEEAKSPQQPQQVATPNWACKSPTVTFAANAFLELAWSVIALQMQTNIMCSFCSRTGMTANIICLCEYKCKPFLLYIKNVNNAIRMRNLHLQTIFFQGRGKMRKRSSKCSDGLLLMCKSGHYARLRNSPVRVSISIFVVVFHIRHHLHFGAAGSGGRFSSLRSKCRLLPQARYSTSLTMTGQLHRNGVANIIT